MEIYSFLDKNGIPFKNLSNIKLSVCEDDILNRLLLENDESIEQIVNKGEMIFSKYHQVNFKQPNLPSKFDLNIREQEEVVIDWIKDTTGYLVKDFQTLFELPLLNYRPFLLQVERDRRGCFLVLATQVINGNMTIREKFHPYHGFLQENFIDSFGQIKRINGNLGICKRIKDFGELEEVFGDLWFSKVNNQDLLDSIYPLKKVSGNLNLKNCHASLDSLEEVGGNLNLRQTTCHSLLSLKKVGGNILLSSHQIDKFNFSNVNVGGKIKIYKDVC